MKEFLPFAGKAYMIIATIAFTLSFTFNPNQQELWIYNPDGDAESANRILLTERRWWFSWNGPYTLEKGAKGGWHFYRDGKKEGPDQSVWHYGSDSGTEPTHDYYR